MKIDSKLASLAGPPLEGAAGTKATKAAGKTAKKASVPAAPNDRSIEMLKSRLLELESVIAQNELESEGHVLQRRIARLEADVATYKAAREKAEFEIADLRASLNRSAVSLQEIRESAEFRMGEILIGATSNWGKLVRLPRALRDWARTNRAIREALGERLVPNGSTAEFTAAVERVLDVAQTRGVVAAEQWAIDQRFRAPVLARVLAELAGSIRASDAKEAARLTAAAFEAEPGEGHLKRLSILLAESGSVKDAASLLRSAKAKGVVFNRTEETRANEVFALEEMAEHGLPLLPKSRAEDRLGLGVLLIAPQAYPFHWTSASIRVHMTALCLIEAGRSVDVVTMPGYPNIGRQKPIDAVPTRKIDGVVYHVLPPTRSLPGFGEEYVLQTSAMLTTLIKQLQSSTILSPSGLVYSYPALVASRTTGASLFLDCFTMLPSSGSCDNERDLIISKSEDEILRHSRLSIARTESIRKRLHECDPSLSVALMPDAMHGASTMPLVSERRPDDGRFVFGYVGDNVSTVDIESLATLLERLVAENIDAHLIIRSVGGRMQAIQQQLEMSGLASRVAIIEKSPNGRRAELAYEDMDAVVVPYRENSGELRSPFQISLALRHAKSVVAIGAAHYREMFGEAIVYSNDMDEAHGALKGFATDYSKLREQEARALAWRDRYGHGNVLAGALEAL